MIHITTDAFPLFDAYTDSFPDTPPSLDAFADAFPSTTHFLILKPTHLLMPLL